MKQLAGSRLMQITEAQTREVPKCLAPAGTRFKNATHSNFSCAHLKSYGAILSALKSGLGSVSILLRNANHAEFTEKPVEWSPRDRFIRFNRKLGSGSYKTVFLGFDQDTGNEVAWNVIKFQDMQKRERRRITSEIGMLKSLKHPRIIAFINAWINKQQEQVCFITERVTGGSLLSYVRRIGQPLKLKVMRRWSSQILDGLNYLHTRDDPVIHRDL
eukprot:3950885-Amphidinium_carterae.1